MSETFTAPQGDWRKSTSQYGYGEDYWIGRIKVGSAFYDGSVPRGSEKRYAASVLLPGIAIKREAHHHETDTEAKAVVERVVRSWFQRLTETVPA